VKHNPTEAEISEYFWSLVDKNGPLPAPATGVRSKCWLWLGSVTDEGYGRFKAGGKTYMATRFAWREKGKPDPGALTVSTRCENRLCVRHLRTRTRSAIMASVTRRWASGEDSWLARTTAKTALQLRKLYAKGNVTQSALADRFGLSLSNVKSILGRRSWKHLARMRVCHAAPSERRFWLHQKNHECAPSGQALPGRRSRRATRYLEQ
jgi:hypothetical protein